MITVKGFSVPHRVVDHHVSLTAGGVTTWVELFSHADASGKTSVIQGDTKDVVRLANDILKAVKEYKHMVTALTILSV